MPVKKYKPEQIVMLLRQIEVEVANGKGLSLRLVQQIGPVNLTEGYAPTLK
jgi:hypothetical protein